LTGPIIKENILVAYVVIFYWSCSRHCKC